MDINIRLRNTGTRDTKTFVVRIVLKRFRYSRIENMLFMC